MDGYPELRFSDFDGTSLDESDPEFFWLGSYIPGAQADITGGGLLQGHLFENTSSDLRPESAVYMIPPANFGTSIPTELGPDVPFSSPSISFSTLGVPDQFMGDTALQDSTYISSVSGVWQGDSGGTTYPGSFEAGVAKATTSYLEWSSHASSVLMPPSDRNGITPRLTPPASTLESPLVGAPHQESTPSTASETYFPLLPAPEVVQYVPPVPLTPDEEKPKKPKNGKRRKRVARTQ